MATTRKPTKTKTTTPAPDAWSHMKSVFADQSVWSYRYNASIHLTSITGGTPSDPRVAKGWLTTRLGGDEARDEMLTARLRETMVERLQLDPTLSQEEVMQQAIDQAAININGFKRTPDGHLFVEGRTVKSMLKEATSIGLGSGHTPARLGLTKKGAPSFVAEHVMVEDDTIRLLRDGDPISDPSEVVQSFVHTWRGSGIDYSEVCHSVDLDFTVVADLDLTDLWPTLWTIAEANGLGARRSQGSGRFVVTRWDRVR